jgi:hypothetical protein
MTGFLKVTVQRESGAVVEITELLMSGPGGTGVGVAPGAGVAGAGLM